MAGQSKARHARPVRRALELVTEAMDLLDAHGAAPEVAVQLALAQQRLRQLAPLEEAHLPEAGTASTGEDQVV